MMAKDYNVGFGRPPRKHQFKKGKSGNPKGRPKGPSFGSAMERELSRTYEVPIDGRLVRLTGAELLAKKVFKKALDGSVRHLDLALEHMPPEPQDSRPIVITLDMGEPPARARGTRRCQDAGEPEEPDQSV